MSVNGKPVDDANQLRLQIGLLSPDSTVTLSVLRAGTPQQVTVKMGAFPSKEERASLDNKETGSALDGVSVENDTKGVVVANVDPSSHAADAGLRAGDVIQQVNRQPVKSVREFDHAIASAKKDDPTLLLVNREGMTLFVAV